MTYKHDPVYPLKPEFYRKEGLTKREYLAAMAMQGIMANSEYIPTVDAHFQNIAQDAVRAADALIKELNK